MITKNDNLTERQRNLLKLLRNIMPHSNIGKRYIRKSVLLELIKGIR